jgi:hypothetical protein
MRRTLALLLLLTPLATPASAARTLFTLADPRGDDHGDGTIRYPLSYYDLAPGDLDLVALSARSVKGGTEFEATFARAVRRPERRAIDIGGGDLAAVARLGFYTTNLDIYVDIDRKPGSGGLTTLPGRKAEIAADHAWERAIALTPRPYEARSALKRLLMRSLREEVRSGEVGSQSEAERLKNLIPGDVEQHVFFPTRVKVAGPKISFFVPDEFLGGKAQPSWSYVVFTSGADVDLRFALPPSINASERDDTLMILPVAPGGAADRFGGKRDDDFMQPPILDLVVPVGEDQEQVLRGYDPVKKIPVTLRGVVPATAPP